MHVLEYQSPPQEPRLPPSVVAVAWIFIAFGILSAMRMIIGLAHGSCVPDLGVLGIFVGRGLLLKRAGWRYIGLAMLWFALIAIPLCSVMLLGYAGNLTFTYINRPAQNAGEIAIIIGMIAGIYAVDAWMCWVLMRKDVAALYERAFHKSAGADG